MGHRFSLGCQNPCLGLGAAIRPHGCTAWMWEPFCTPSWGTLGPGTWRTVLLLLSMIVVAGPLDKEWKRKDCSSPLVSEVLLLPPTSASMGEAER